MAESSAEKYDLSLLAFGIRSLVIWSLSRSIISLNVSSHPDTLYTLGINLIRNHLKKKARDVASHTMGHQFSEPQTKGDESGEGDFPSEDSMRRLDENMQKLPVDLREAIILKFHQDMTFEEISAITGDSLSAVKMRVYRGLEKLKQLMEVVKL